VTLTIKAQPRAARNEVVDLTGSELRLKIAAPPVDSAANTELVRFLAELLDCPRGAVTLVRGGTSRRKLVKIHGLTRSQSLSKLG